MSKIRPARSFCFVLLEPVPRSSTIISPTRYHARDRDPVLGELDTVPGVSVEYMDDHPNERQAMVGRVLAIGLPGREVANTFKVQEKNKDGTVTTKRMRHRGHAIRWRELAPPDFEVNDVVLYPQGAAPFGHTLDRSYRLAAAFGYPGRQVFILPQSSIEAVLPKGVPSPGRIQ